MRKLFLLGALGVPLLLWLSVSATPPAPATWTVKLRAPHGFQPGDVVEEAGRPIGHVLTVLPDPDPRSGGGTAVVITLDPPSRERLRTRSTFLVHKPSASARPVLRLVVFDEHSPPLPPGSFLTAAESDMEVELKRQLTVMEGAVRALTQQLDALRQGLDQAARSEEKQRLEESVGGLMETLRRTRDEFARVLTEEFARWKKLYEKLFPPEREKPVRAVS
ncbi:MAG: hypothetical protein NZ578_03860 [Candidatus Binatia bacterium]|nr:hypothetical protein [Candidatus Binatia bacterium]